MTPTAEARNLIRRDSGSMNGRGLEWDTPSSGPPRPFSRSPRGFILLSATRCPQSPHKPVSPPPFTGQNPFPPALEGTKVTINGASSRSVSPSPLHLGETKACAAEDLARGLRCSGTSLARRFTLPRPYPLAGPCESQTQTFSLCLSSLGRERGCEGE